MESMTVTRGLAELKLLNDRIESATKTYFIGVNKKSSGKINQLTEAEFIENIKANYQRVTDLIKRRAAIKSAIVTSNARTLVKIGDKEMTVAEAIERKESISHDKNLYSRLQESLLKATAELNLSNQRVADKADEMVMAMLGSDGKQKASKEDIENITKPYIAQNEWQIIDPLRLEKLTGEMKAEIEDFILNVDFALSESNSVTKIEI